MIAPIPPPRPESRPPQRARSRDRPAELTAGLHDAAGSRRLAETLSVAGDDDALLRRLDATELFDIHRGLDWCERELRALPLLDVAQRRRVAELRRRWAQRWRAATGRPAVSLQALRAWQLAAILGVGATLLAALNEPEERAGPPRRAAAPPPPPAVTPAATVAPPPEAVPLAAPASSDARDNSLTDGMARVRARDVARELERCGAAARSFLSCQGITTPDARSPVTFTELTTSTFEVHVASSSGHDFGVRRGPRATIRVCTPEGSGRCPPTGRW